jgi:DNA helicase IV
MALTFFKQRDIDKMDINNIPEEFINYFDTLDTQGKIALIGSRPDIAKALGLQLSKYRDSSDTSLNHSDMVDDNAQEESFYNEEFDRSIDENELSDAVETNQSLGADSEELQEIRKNCYEGKDLSQIVKNEMRPLVALAISKGQKFCTLHRVAFEQKNIKYKAPNGAVLSMVLRICKQCNRIYLEEDSMSLYHEKLVEHGVPHTFYDLMLTNKYLQSLMSDYAFSDKEKLYFPDTWIEENPKCPIDDVALFKIPCSKTYKNRKIRFTGYFCNKCQKIMVRRTTAVELEDKCAETGIPIIESVEISKKAPEKKAVSNKMMKPEYIVENGKRSQYTYNQIVKNCFNLTEDDTVVVSDSIYCNLDGHETEQILALIWIDQKKDGRVPYLFLVGYCAQCQKYYMNIDDYKAVYSIGRLEVSILNDLDLNYHITSGQTFHIEKDHLDNLEGKISKEINGIRNSPDFVSRYATGDYDDGNLSFAKYNSERKYEKKLEKLQNCVNKPYAYRVDISTGEQSETYYIGATDIDLDNGRQVISANTNFGHDLINYQTIKVHKDGKEYGIELSRQFDIENAKLYGYSNLRTNEDEIFKKGITDPFLVRVLRMRKHQHNLTDIFVTIQENQNKIVNADFQKNLIVQGCAGSGKTMVLLHRLSYLSYHHSDFNFSENAMILTPNDKFNLHIKGVAEELHISYIPRMSVEEYYITILIGFNKLFQPKNKVVSEASVNQDFVDYVYSDQFKEDFNKAYINTIRDRNKIVGFLDDLTDVMKLPRRTISLEDNSKVESLMKKKIEAINMLVQNADQEVKSAKKKYEELQLEKQSIESNLSKSKYAAERALPEALAIVQDKIKLYIGQQSNELETMKNIEDSLLAEKSELQEKFLVLGKKNRLKELEMQIQDIKEKLLSAEDDFKAKSALLSEPQKDKTNDEIISWMRLVAQYIDDVQEDIRICTRKIEIYDKYKKDLSEIEQQLLNAKERYDAAIQNVYGDRIHRAASYLNDRINQYSLLGTYQLVFDEATKNFRAQHDIRNIRGKIHRYDLYTQLLFAMRYFGYPDREIRFMCIDEAQDLSINEYRLIYDLNKQNLVFNVFGDTNQLMNPGRGISNWHDFEKEFSAERYELNENYRNTNQITKFCNSSFNMSVLHTGVDGSKVREIARKDLENELSALNVTTQRIAILVPRAVQKEKYLKADLISSELKNRIGENMDNGYIALMYVDEVKGIEFDKVFVVSNGMSRNEKYIAYTRALSDLIIVVDDSIKPKKVTEKKKQNSADKKNKKEYDQQIQNNILKWEAAAS